MSTNEGLEHEPDDQSVERTLLALLAVLIPPGGGGRIPGAADIGFPAAVRATSDYPAIREGLLRLMAATRDGYGREFFDLDAAEQARMIDGLKVKDFRFFSALSIQIIKSYYQDTKVMMALGHDHRPPFPLGHDVQEGDLSLLEPVYERGRKYRTW